MTVVGASFAVSCPRCAGPLDWVNTGRPAEAGTRTTSIVRCPPCRIEWQITATLRPVHQP